MAMGRPKKPPGVRVPVRFSRDQHEILQAFAKYQGKPLSEVIAGLIAPGLPTLAQIVELGGLVRSSGANAAAEAHQALKALLAEAEGVLEEAPGTLKAVKRRLTTSTAFSPLQGDLEAAAAGIAERASTPRSRGGASPAGAAPDRAEGRSDPRSSNTGVTFSHPIDKATKRG